MSQDSNKKDETVIQQSKTADFLQCQTFILKFLVWIPGWAGTDPPPRCTR